MKESCLPFQPSDLTEKYSYQHMKKIYNILYGRRDLNEKIKLKIHWNTNTSSHQKTGDGKAT